MRESMNQCGFAAAHCGKALPYRRQSLLNLFLRLSLRKERGRVPDGKAKPYRTVRRPSRTGSLIGRGEKVLRGGGRQLHDTWQ